jgi:hypothetical protein
MKKKTFGKVVSNRGSFPDTSKETRCNLSGRAERNSPDVRVTNRQIHGRVTVPWVVLEFDVQTTTQWPISTLRRKERRR